MNLMLVDDSTLFLEGLQYLLETRGINVAGVAMDGKEGFEKARILKPDIILMDIKMPKYSGLDALKLIKAEMPEIKIVMLTTSDDDEDLFNTLKFGASGYLLKNTSAEKLVDMLHGIDKGEAPLSPAIATRLLKEFRDNSNYEAKTSGHKPGSKEERLTKRQQEVLEMVVQGMTYKEVSETMKITERTVKYHMGEIINRLHLENKAQVIAYATRVGILKKSDNTP